MHGLIKIYSQLTMIFTVCSQSTGSQAGERRSGNDFWRTSRFSHASVSSGPIIMMEIVHHGQSNGFGSKLRGDV